MEGEDELTVGGGVPIRPPRLEDAGLEDCALPPESISEAFSLAAAAVASRLARLPFSEDSDDDEGRVEEAAWMTPDLTSGPPPTPLSAAASRATAASTKSWSSAQGAEADTRTRWWSVGAKKRRMQSWRSGSGAGRRSWGRRMDASRGSEKGSVNPDGRKAVKRAKRRKRRRSWCRISTEQLNF